MGLLLFVYLFLLADSREQVREGFKIWRWIWVAVGFLIN